MRTTAKIVSGIAGIVLSGCMPKAQPTSVDVADLASGKVAQQTYVEFTAQVASLGQPRDISADGLNNTVQDVTFLDPKTNNSTILTVTWAPNLSRLFVPDKTIKIQAEYIDLVSRSDGSKSPGLINIHLE
jgi:hypothetical protein